MTYSFLTESKKKQWLPRLIEDQGGFICYQCEQTLKPGHYCYEHLNDKRDDTRYENTGLACNSCNIKKIDDFDMKLKASELLKKKEEAGLKYLEDKTVHEQYSSEIEINKAMYTFTQQFLLERINTDGKIEFSDVLDCIVYLCQERFGHGSEQTVRRYIKQLTCGVAPYKVIRDEKNQKWIVKRSEN